MNNNRLYWLNFAYFCKTMNSKNSKQTIMFHYDLCVYLCVYLYVYVCVYLCVCEIRILKVLVVLNHDCITFN